MKTHFDIEEFVLKGKIENELDFERALIADRKLRLLSRESVHFKTLRKKLRDIIEIYETNNWSDENAIDEDKIKESDIAELIAEKEREFIENRKTIIKNKLKDLNLNQQELGSILGHKSKTHMSELMNGISPFSLKDLILINRLLKIDISELIPVFLPKNEQIRVKNAILKLNKPKIKLTTDDLIFA